MAAEACHQSVRVRSVNETGVEQTFTLNDNLRQLDQRQQLRPANCPMPRRAMVGQLATRRKLARTPGTNQ
jgi:hypothetical protein